MSYGSYPTPSQVGIYIGPYHVDDAYSVEWQLTDTSSPMFTYFNKYWVNVAKGKQIISGNIGINFRYPGYLATAIRAARKRAEIPEDIIEKTKTKSGFIDNYLSEMRDGTASERLDLLIQAAEGGDEVLRKMSALAYAAQNFSDDFSSVGGKYMENYVDVFEEQRQWNDKIVPVDIWTHYGNTNEIHIAEVLEDVVFTGKSKQNQAGASPSGGLSASGINIIEVYSFFAKDVRTVKINPNVI